VLDPEDGLQVVRGLLGGSRGGGGGGLGRHVFGFRSCSRATHARKVGCRSGPEGDTGVM
jgi:hypothetical protein